MFLLLLASSVVVAGWRGLAAGPSGILSTIRISTFSGLPLPLTAAAAFSGVPGVLRSGGLKSGLSAAGSSILT
jgi:hypothetical protein